MFYSDCVRLCMFDVEKVDVRVGVRACVGVDVSIVQMHVVGFVCLILHVMCAHVQI